MAGKRNWSPEMQMRSIEARVRFCTVFVRVRKSILDYRVRFCTVLYGWTFFGAGHEMGQYSAPNLKLAQSITIRHTAY